MFKEVLEKGAEYADVRISEIMPEFITLDKSKQNVSSSISFFYGARVFYKGAWGFVSGNNIEELRDALLKALKIAKLASKNVREKFKLENVSAVKDVVKAPCKVKPKDVELKEKVELAKEVVSYIKSKKEIDNFNLSFFFRDYRNRFYNSEGAEIIEEKSISDIRLSLLSFKGGELFRGFARLGRSDGFDYFKKKNVLSLAKDAYSSLKRQMKAKHAPAGKMPVIMDNDLAGVFFHEALGHACEADAILADSSVLKDKMEKQIAPDFLTLRDSPNVKYEHGFFKYDDEGIPAKNTLLIDKGVLVGYMHNLETASKMGVEPTGNGRAQNPSYIPIPRMTNTIAEPGDYSFEELFEDVKYGIYAKGSFGGVVNPINGNFLFNAQEAYLVENGRITTPLKDVSFGGNILETLWRIEKMANDDLPSFTGGFCGKSGQYVPVGTVAPHVLLSEAMVGGSS